MQYNENSRPSPRRVIIETSFARTASRERAIEFTQAAVKDSLARGEAPIAFHLLYPLVLNETLPERQEGLQRAGAWYDAAAAIVVYLQNDEVPSEGIRERVSKDRNIEIRYLAAPPEGADFGGTLNLYTMNYPVCVDCQRRGSCPLEAGTFAGCVEFSPGLFRNTETDVESAPATERAPQ